MTKEQQENTDRLAEIIANFVGVNDIGFDNIAVVDDWFNQINPDPIIRNFWNDRIAKALRETAR